MAWAPDGLRHHCEHLVLCSCDADALANEGLSCICRGYLRHAAPYCYCAKVTSFEMLCFFNAPEGEPGRYAGFGT
jgi:hypothetical protein